MFVSRYPSLQVAEAVEDDRADLMAKDNDVRWGAHFLFVSHESASLKSRVETSNFRVLFVPTKTNYSPFFREFSAAARIEPHWASW